MSEARHASSGLPAALVDEWVRAGVTDVFISPGARSTPITIACSHRLRVHMVLDERSAGFRALGFGLGAGRPAVAVCTSGTAAAHYSAAVREADESAVPLIVCTADRPPELHDTGAPQAMDQHRLYGAAVRWFFDPGPPDDHPAAGRLWRSMGARSVAEATGRRPGPVHLNLPFREPFLAEAPAPVPPGRDDDRPWTEVVPATVTTPPRRLAAAVGSIRRGVIVAGQGAGVDAATVAAFSTATGWPVLADVLSNVRTAGTVATFDALIRASSWAAGHRPDVVVRLGRPPTSKRLERFVADVDETVMITPRAPWADPTRANTLVVEGEPETLLQSLTDGTDRRGEWYDRWVDADRIARRTIDDVLDGLAPMSEPRIARDFAAALPDGARAVLASSMPVRDVDAFARPRSGVEWFANRGINGIDGTLSTALGIAATSGAPVAVLEGDQALLHDLTALIGLADSDADLTAVVVDNDGGGIFSFLPHRGLDQFERLFSTPHGTDLAAVIRGFGLPVTEVDEAGDVAAAVAGGGEKGPRFVVARTEREANVALHRRLWDAVSDALA